ncbi:hypothetical protein WN51_06462 [Melipona quadrifasciata]|uniref:Uncharacterized protein n=1 Tax=Melipona quadrifasciata TaxID=166423 RepID=A0A0N0BK67_9HYME|nr:hypothetical protein WN51_06462 [Melipona quadrifasciata]
MQEITHGTKIMEQLRENSRVESTRHRAPRPLREDSVRVTTSLPYSVLPTLRTADNRGCIRRPRSTTVRRPQFRTESGEYSVLCELADCFDAKPLISVNTKNNKVKNKLNIIIVRVSARTCAYEALYYHEPPALLIGYLEQNRQKKSPCWRTLNKLNFRRPIRTKIEALSLNC